VQELDELHAAAHLLLEIAGDANEHVRMTRGGRAKYYTVFQPLELDVDPALAAHLPPAALAGLRASTTTGHLLGVTTIGASLWRADAYTRALCFDVDDRAGWRLLILAARRLAQAGYAPLLEESPAGRGGHLWLIYTDLVESYAALHQVRTLAPDLAGLAEWWPRPGAQPSGNKVRLPGGRYTVPGISRWCRLFDIHGVVLAENGQSAASILLSLQTPAALVPALDEEARAELVRQLTPAPAVPARPAREPQTPAPATGPDAHWQGKYGTSDEGRKLWFAFSQEQIIARFNEKHHVRDLLATEPNGYGLAVWRSEQTGSVGFFDQENAWIDFGATALRSSGKHDGGDALELFVRLSGREKQEVMRDLARDLNREARAALEDAARSGQEPPNWVQHLLTESGWHYYQSLRVRHTTPPEPS
jgi:hypothetical protein